MRRIIGLIFLLPLAALASCGRTELPVAEDNVIRFTDYVPEYPNTKAYAERTITDIRQDGFNVACITQDGTTVFNEKAAWDNAANVYVTTKGRYYFPNGKTVTFSAVYPASQAIAVNEGATSLSYTHNPDTDLLAAYRAGVAKQSTSVELAFDHVLSLVRFKVAGKDSAVKYKVRSISFTVPGTGVYTYANGTWAPSGSAAVAAYSGTLALDGVTEVPGAWTMIPSESIVTVAWETWSADGSTLIAEYNESKTMGTLLKGEDNTVTIMLSNKNADAMTLTVTVNPWSSKDTSIEIE